MSPEREPESLASFLATGMGIIVLLAFTYYLFGRYVWPIMERN